MARSEETLSWFFALCIAIALHAILGVFILSWILATVAQTAPAPKTQIKISSLVVEASTKTVQTVEPTKTIAKTAPSETARLAQNETLENIKPQAEIAQKVENIASKPVTAVAKAPKSSTVQPTVLARAGVAPSFSAVQSAATRSKSPANVKRETVTALTDKPKANVAKRVDPATNKVAKSQTATPEPNDEKQTATIAATNQNETTLAALPQKPSEQLKPIVSEPQVIKEKLEKIPEAPDAGSLPAEQATPKDGVASAAFSEIQTEQEARETYETVLDFLKSYDAGSCFTALPSLTEGNAFQLEAFALAREQLDKFRNELTKETNVLPATALKPVSSEQCRALSFVRATQKYPAFSLYFELKDRVIPSGSLLQGSLGNTNAGFVSLLLIDDEGIVQNLGSFLKFQRGAVGFSIPMTVQGNPVVTQQLLMGLSTRTRPATIKSMSGQKADEFFFALTEELAANNDEGDLAVVAFSVQ